MVFPIQIGVNDDTAEFDSLNPFKFVPIEKKLSNFAIVKPHFCMMRTHIPHVLEQYMVRHIPITDCFSCSSSDENRVCIYITSLDSGNAS